MKILFCNKYNYPFSGTEVYMFELMVLMRAHGHETALFSMADSRGQLTPYDEHFVLHIDFKSGSGRWRKMVQVPRASYSGAARRRIRAMIQAFRLAVAQ